MFSRARLRISLLYAALMGVLVALVAGLLTISAVYEARHTADLELRKRAEGAAAMGAALGLPPQAVAVPAPPGPLPEEDPLAWQGIVTYVLPVIDGRVRVPAAMSTILNVPEIPGLPDEPAAREAIAAGREQYRTVSLPQGTVRLFSLPVVRDGATIAVVQTARSRAFLEASAVRLLLVTLGVGAIGLVLSTVAGYWPAAPCARSPGRWSGSAPSRPMPRMSSAPRSRWYGATPNCSCATPTAPSATIWTWCRTLSTRATG